LLPTKEKAPQRCGASFASARLLVLAALVLAALTTLLSALTGLLRLLAWVLLSATLLAATLLAALVLLTLAALVLTTLVLLVHLKHSSAMPPSNKQRTAAAGRLPPSQRLRQFFAKLASRLVGLGLRRRVVCHPAIEGHAVSADCHSFAIAVHG
jgi:hypothetical protein